MHFFKTGCIFSHLTGDRRSRGERDRAEAEDEPNALGGPLRPADVEGNGAEHGDEAAIKDAQDEGEHDHGRELESRHQWRSRQQHCADADHEEAQLWVCRIVFF